MTGRYGRALTVVATVGSGLAAGVFFAFSNTTRPAGVAELAGSGVP
jgi:uncharacterized membrane protein